MDDMDDDMDDDMADVDDDMDDDMADVDDDMADVDMATWMSSNIDPKPEGHEKPNTNQRLTACLAQ